MRVCIPAQLLSMPRNPASRHAGGQPLTASHSHGDCALPPDDPPLSVPVLRCAALPSACVRCVQLRNAQCLFGFASMRVWVLMLARTLKAWPTCRLCVHVQNTISLASHTGQCSCLHSLCCVACQLDVLNCAIHDSQPPPHAEDAD